MVPKLLETSAHTNTPYAHAQLIDTKTLDVLKTYPTETPLNSAAIHPTRPFVIVGGGQEAMNVTTTSARQGKFETRFWHKVFEEECARLPGHFGPINTIAIHPMGKAYASGGEDGYGEWIDQLRCRNRSCHRSVHPLTPQILPHVPRVKCESTGSTKASSPRSCTDRTLSSRRKTNRHLIHCLIVNSANPLVLVADAHTFSAASVSLSARMSCTSSSTQLAAFLRTA